MYLISGQNRKKFSGPSRPWLKQMPNQGRGQASERGVSARGTPGRGLMRGRGNPARSGRGAPRGGRRHDVYGVSRWPPTGTGAMIPLDHRNK